MHFLNHNASCKKLHFKVKCYVFIQWFHPAKKHPTAVTGDYHYLLKHENKSYLGSKKISAFI